MDNNIKNVADLENSLTPSYSLGYPMYWICKDGGVLSEEAVIERKDEIIDAINEPDTNTQWEVIHCEINYEDPDLYCDHTYKPIPTAY